MTDKKAEHQAAKHEIEAKGQAVGEAVADGVGGLPIGIPLDGGVGLRRPDQEDAATAKVYALPLDAFYFNVFVLININ